MPMKQSFLVEVSQERNEVGWRPGQETGLLPHVGLSEANVLY